MPSNIDQLLQLIKDLHHDTNGCAWTKDQSFQSLAPQTLEEVYELLEAIDRNDSQSIKDELGDLLYHVVFYAHLAEQQHQFDFNDVAGVMLSKDKARRASEGERAISAEQTNSEWEASKSEQRKRNDPDASVLAGVATTLPALTRAIKLQKRAAETGFDWPDIAPIFEKMSEEIAELKVELKENDQQKIQDELGDILFTVTNLARYLQIDPETALRQANNKFSRRFQHVEQQVKVSKADIQDMRLDELNVLWEKAKQTTA